MSLNNPFLIGVPQFFVIRKRHPGEESPRGRVTPEDVEKEAEEKIGVRAWHRQKGK